MIRFTLLCLTRGYRNVLGALALVTLLFASRAALAIVPVNNTVVAGAYDAAVRITNFEGGRGTGTLFGKHYSPDPANPVGNPQRYLNLCFLTADHVLRPLMPGGVPNDPENDNIPAGSIYEDAPNYGNGYDPTPQPQAVLDTYVGSIGFRGINEASAFDLTPANGIVARKVILGDGLSGVGNLRTDLAFAAIRVDLDNPLITPAQKVILNGLAPENLTAVVPPAGPYPVALPANGHIAFSVEGGYGLSGRPDVAYPAHDYVYHPPLPADEQYGRERFLDNEWTRFVETQGFYNYVAAQWYLTAVMNQAGQQVGTLGVGLTGDSGAGLNFGNNLLVGALTAGKLDKLNAAAPFIYGLKYGYFEIGAPVTELAQAAFLEACENFVMQIPEPTTAVMAMSCLTLLLGYRRKSRCDVLTKRS